MHSNEADEDARGEVARGNKPALGPAGGVVDIKRVLGKPGNVEQEGHGLLDVGEKQVVDEHEELVRRVVP